jgi:ribosome-associated protein
MAGLRDLRISSRRALPARLLSVRYARSSGPGGQHVNKTETKVDLRLDTAGLTGLLRDAEIARLRRRLSNRITEEGELVVTVDEHRERHRNLEVALARMEEMIRKAITPPKVRKATKPTKGSKERRLKSKRKNAERKRMRQKPPQE